MWPNTSGAKGRRRYQAIVTPYSSDSEELGSLGEVEDVVSHLGDALRIQLGQVDLAHHPLDELMSVLQALSDLVQVAASSA